MNRIATISALGLALSAAACAQTGRGNVLSEGPVTSIAGQTFDAVEVSGPYRVEFSVAPEHSVEVNGTERGLRDLQIDVKDGVLRVRRDCWGICNSNGTLATVRVAAPAIDNFSINMGAEAEAPAIQAETLDVDVNMGATFRIAGTCGTVNADVNMGAVLHAENLACRQANVDANMGAVANVNATESANGDANMGAEIRVSGAPAQRQTGENMGGQISFQ